MPLPGLKSSIELQSGATGLQLIDRLSGQKWPLSETESRLLSLWDGVLTATGLSARLFVEGLDIEPWQVEQFFTRLSRAGVLAASAPVVPDFIPTAAGIEEPGDVVPTLRGDLVVTRSKTSAGTMEVKDPLSGRSFTLYDFELSIARMLDGKRTAAEVLAAANRLGIPVTLPTLKTFLQQLRAYQFIALQAGGGGTTWPKRRKWTGSVRELYQSALRLLRARKYDEARGCADAMVEADPGNEDAIVLRHRIIAEAAGSHELNIPFDTLHTPVTASVATRLDSQPSSAGPFASFGINPEPLPAAALPGGAAPARRRSAPAPDEAEPALPPPPRRRRALSLVATVVVVLVVLLHPVEAMVELPCELQMDELGVPRAPRAGPVGPAEVASGAQVEKGAVLARLTLAVGESPEALEASIKELEKRLAGNRPPPNPQDLARAQAAVKKATAAVAALTRQQKKKASKKQLAALEKKLGPKQKALDAATAALTALEQGESPADLKRSLEQLTSKKVAAAIQGERAVITAPAAGLFIAPEPLPEKLAENDPYGRIISPAFRVVTKDPLMTNADTAVFKGPGFRADVKLTHGPQGDSAVVDGQIKWMGAKGTMEVSSGRTPWIVSLVR